MKKYSLLLISLISMIFLFPDTSTSQNIMQVDAYTYVAGIPSDEFEFFSASSQHGRQRQNNWCWAACIQMVLNYHGLYISQEELVAKVYGNLMDQPANEQQIIYALSGWAPNVMGGYSQIYCQSGLNNPNEITQNLAYKWPLIVGMSNPQLNIGHAYVLTAIYYQVDAYNNTIPIKVVVRDPWPDSPSRQELSWEEFTSRLLMVIKVWVSR